MAQGVHTSQPGTVRYTDWGVFTTCVFRILASDWSALISPGNSRSSSYRVA